MSGRLNRDEWRVDDIDHATALELIRAHHYAGNGPNTAVYRHGLFRVGDDTPMGVALWLPPPPNGAKSAALDMGEPDWHAVISLSRLVIDPSVPTNGASFLIGRSIRRIAADGRYRVLLTFADEYQGHTGAIYRATNWRYTGPTPPYTAWVDADGVLVSKKAGKVSRTVEQMVALGYTRIGPFRKHRFVRLAR